jgi:acyl transferase domain-containing protein
MLQWPENSIRRASVNSFGYGGTNAHVVLEGVEDYLKSIGNLPSLNSIPFGALGGSGKLIDNSLVGKHGIVEPWSLTDSARPSLFVLSHDHDGEIEKLAANIKRFVSDHESSEVDELLDSLAFTLSDRRTFLEFRSSITASTRDELVDGLEKLANGYKRLQRYNEPSRLCFAFTGMQATDILDI